MPPANSFLTEEECAKKESNFPLTVSFCDDCYLVQSQDVVDSSVLFKDYVYMTSGSKPLVEHFERLAQKLLERLKLSKDDLVIDIGSNDGTFLKPLQKECIVIGVEPAHIMAEVSRGNGIPTEENFFDLSLARSIKERYGKARLILAANVFAHIDDIHTVCAGVEEVLDDNGIFVIEAHWVGNLIGDGGFDQIYHEHLCYYSLTALSRLLEKHNLTVVDIEFVPNHGESMRVFAAKSGPVNDSVALALKRERDLGLDKLETFEKFAQKVKHNREHLVATIAQLKSQGKKIAGYGAPAKGNTLLNYCGIGRDSVDYITDATPLKHGLYAPGSHIPVVPPERLKEDVPDYLLLLAWNYKESILKKEGTYRKKGGKFIVPVPEVSII